MPGDNGEIMVLELGAHNELLMLNEYKGRISMIVCQRGTDGKNYFRMCYPKKKDGAGDVAIPQGIRLGARKQAIGILKQFTLALEKMEG